MLTVTDLFCGAGGSSSGMVQIPGVRIRMAANHWNLAIESHQTNHPDTDHDSADLSQVEPSRYPTTDILWASPECTNHSVAKGIKRQRALQAALPGMEEKPLADEAAIRSRATMWDVPRFAEYHQYRAIIIENVVDAYRWVQFPAWLLAMELLGYEHDIVWLNSMHAQAMGLPAPQSRDRMYVVFWKKGQTKPELQKWTRPQALCETHGVIRAVQVFKKAERWGRYRAQYVYRCPQCAVVVEPAWLPASSAIDWSIPGQRIGDRDKALAEKTRARIQAGIERYWRPLVVEAGGNTYDSMDPKHPAHGEQTGYVRAWPTEQPLRTLHTSVSKGVAVPPLVINHVSGADESRSQPHSAALPTLVGGGLHASLLVPVEGREGKSAASAGLPMRTQSTRNETALLVPYYSTGTARPTADPMGTVATVDRNALVVPLRNHGVTKPATAVIDTVSANGNHHGLLMRNNQGGAEMSTPVAETMRTLTTGGHQSLLEPTAPVSLDVDDCLFRMLEPHEIKVGMAFARDYVLLGNKREQVKQSGNAVTPPAARDLMAAVAESLGHDVELVAA
ncbi:DNA cytosine methyltransferase [Rathayibacter sp. Leaf248]|uniref:DNA cytosine methyltransferase n=1 Tax=Rathayibacter sp. Leaf248 TaxID=2876555 RepID=UPI001E3A82FB|nr:DNA cytosine methyltransferase [Rathayibacter sp. Leaf248]